MIEIEPCALEGWAVGLVFDCLGPECSEQFYYDAAEVIELNVGTIGSAASVFLGGIDLELGDSHCVSVDKNPGRSA